MEKTCKTCMENLSRKTDFDLLREFESVCDQLLGSRKGKK